MAVKVARIWHRVSCPGSTAGELPTPARGGVRSPMSLERLPSPLLPPVAVEPDAAAAAENGAAQCGQVAAWGVGGDDGEGDGGGSVLGEGCPWHCSGFFFFNTKVFRRYTSVCNQEINSLQFAVPFLFVVRLVISVLVALFSYFWITYVWFVFSKFTYLESK